MKKDVAEKWVAALRSGLYKQGRNALKSKDGYCCLGVLCDISGVDTFDTDEFGDEYYLGHCSNLPDQVVQYAGVRGKDPLPIEGSLGFSLANLNDRGDTFEQIATVIEKNWRIL